jgi:endonuclease/exonuclease/phosphatase family metal-dependent hydrolase
MKRRNFLKQLGLATTLPLLSRATFATAADVPAKTGTSHKILSCNVRVDMPGDAKTGDSWAERKALCGDIIKAQKADLIGLQEGQQAHLSYLKSRMPEYDSYALSHAVDYFHPVDAILFLRERYELISAGGFWLSETPHLAASKSWDSALPRLANWVHLKERSSGKEFRYWNTHLDHKGQNAREKGATMIVQASAALPKTFPQILTGDMNASIENPAIKNFKEGGWIDTYAAANGSKDPGSSFHGFKGEKSGHGAKIDWIFCRGTVEPIVSTIIRDGRNNHYPSDHYFVLAEVAIG